MNSATNFGFSLNIAFTVSFSNLLSGSGSVSALSIPRVSMNSM